MTPNICLAINYLVLTESARQMWINLARHLEEFNFQLVLMSSAVAEPPLPFPVIPIPFLLRDYATQFPGVAQNSGHYSAGDWELLQADVARAQGAYGPAEAIPGLQVCREIMNSVLKTLQPGYVLTWDSTSPLALIVQRLCHEAGLPVQSLERGLLPETLMIESRGMQGYADLRTHWLAQEMPPTSTEAYERVRAFYLNRKPQKYQQPDFNGGGTALREELKLDEKRAVVFFGHYDPCGLAPADSLQRRHHSPAFSSTEDTLMSLSGLLKNSTENVLIFKPHPLDRNPYEAAKKEGVRIVTDVNVHALTDLAAVVVAQFTTLQFEAALYDKPVLLAGHSAWWGRGAAYEVARRENLGPQLLAALRGDDWATRLANARNFLAWIMEHWLIGCGSGVPTRRNLSDLAKFLATTALDANSPLTAELRVKLMEKQFRLWRGTSAVESANEMPEASRRRADELFVQGKCATPAAATGADVQENDLRDRAELLRELGSWEQAGEIYRTLANQLPDDFEVCQRRLECVEKAGQKFLVGLLRGDALRAHPEWAKRLQTAQLSSVR